MEQDYITMTTREMLIQGITTRALPVRDVASVIDGFLDTYITTRGGKVSFPMPDYVAQTVEWLVYQDVQPRTEQAGIAFQNAIVATTSAALDALGDDVESVVKSLTGDGAWEYDETDVFHWVEGVIRGAVRAVFVTAHGNGVIVDGIVVHYSDRVRDAVRLLTDRSVSVSTMSPF